MAGRPRLPIGTFGDITVSSAPAGGYRAVTRLREWDGRIRRVSATGASKAAAKSALKQKIAERDPVPGGGGLITGDTLFAEVAQLWLEEIDLDAELSDGTKDFYRRGVRLRLLPTFEHLTLREITTGRVERFLKMQAAESASKARIARTVLNLVMKYALRHEAIPRNPVEGTSRIKSKTPEPVALTLAELAAIRRAARSWRTAEHQPGPKPDGQVRDIIEVMLGTSARIGEALGLRKCDVDVTANPPTVTIAGTVVVRTGKPIIRQPIPKTHASHRTTAIPQFAADVLRARLASIGEADEEQLLFVTKRGTPLSPYNVRRVFRDVLRLAGLADRDIHLHSLRKTVATIISREADDDLAARTLGHTGPQITRIHYIAPDRAVDPRPADILQALAPESMPG